MKVAEIVEAHKPLIDEFQKAGISARLYTRPPLRKEVFTIGVENNELRIWPGDGVALKASFDPEKRQAVLKVDESDREFSVKGDTVCSHFTRDRMRHDHLARSGQWGDMRAICKAQTCPSVQSAIKADIRSRLSLPKGTVITVKTAEWTNTHRGELSYTASVKATETSTSFLVGIDETSHFVSQLSSHPSSVRVAHQALKPSGTPKDALRQGEWFFVKATPEEVEAVNHAVIADEHASVRHGAGRGAYGWELRERVNSRFTVLENGSSHRVTFGIKVGDDRFVNGMVYDTREGRHAPLQLDGWYKIVRNTEVVQARPRRNSQNRNSGPRWD